MFSIGTEALLSLNSSPISIQVFTHPVTCKRTRNAFASCTEYIFDSIPTCQFITDTTLGARGLSSGPTPVHNMVLSGFLKRAFWMLVLPVSTRVGVIGSGNAEARGHGQFIRNSSLIP